MSTSSRRAWKELLAILRCPLHPGAGPLLPGPVEPDPAEPGAVNPGGGGGLYALEVPDAAASRVDLLLRCPACGRSFPVRDGIPDLAVRTEHNAAFIELEARQWDDQSRSYDHVRRLWAEYAAGVAAAVEALAPEAGDLVLETAAGTGLTTRRYHGRGCRIVALDISLQSLRLLRDGAGDEVSCVRGDMQHLPFASGRFDRALCANAMQHVPTAVSRRRCLAELGRVVRSGGRVAITAHQYSTVRRRRGWRREGGTVEGPAGVRYIHRFEADEFTRLLAAELEVERVLGAGYPLPYRLKLSPLSRRLEPLLQRRGLAVGMASMLVGVCRARGR